MSLKSFLLSLGAVLVLTTVVLAIPGCQYHALDGSSLHLKRGKSYVDVGDRTDGTCIQEATCRKDHTVGLAQCALIRIKVNCSLVEDTTQFPSCCVCPLKVY